IRIEIAKEPVKGGLYYWANPGNPLAGVNDGILRKEFGDLSPSEQFFTGSKADAMLGTSGHCVACHALSRDGTKFAVNFDTPTAPAGGVFDVATLAGVVPINMPRFQFA